MENQSQFQNDHYQQRPPKSWLVESILVMVLCCLPFGIVGLIHASRVESKFYAGDFDGSYRDSLEAAKWVKIGFFAGIAPFILMVLYFMAVLGFVSFGAIQ